ncbi:MAG TPA: SLBB domain-containing protein [Candidatus Cloacimonadota bacterium]|nr:SLBB domain-containing protein [Candidatus Cloacimonadota bacterium]HPT71781.1 SLBB domain-containing protein [Candidatus Cloacimonadota bacterium]
MKKLLLVMILVIVMSAAFGQVANTASYPMMPTMNNASAYTYSGSMSNEEKLKIYTYIWGQVLRPGLYIVPDDTDLLTLLSLAGGPSENAKLTKIRIIRPTSTSQKVIMVNLKEYMETGNETLIPILQPGDTVIVSGTIFYAFTRVTDFLSKVAIALSIYVTVHSIK